MLLLIDFQFRASGGVAAPRFSTHNPLKYEARALSGRQPWLLRAIDEYGGRTRHANRTPPP
jgi:hypothetical protein